MRRICLVLILGLVAGTHAVRAEEHIVHARLDHMLDDFTVNKDLSFTRTITRDITLLTPRALRALDRSVWTYYPDKQKVELVEAWVDQPDGTRITVPQSAIFTRPSAASQSAPGFVNSLTVTALFPQLKPGSHTHAVWRVTQATPSLLGFNAYNMQDTDWDTVLDETRIAIPADVPFHWGQRGGIAVEESVKDGIRHIDARIENTKSIEAEPAMTSDTDFMPIFVASSLSGLAETGRIIYHAAEGRADPTPEITALANRIAGDKTGLDAARALHAWVTQNIRYIAVYMNPNDGWVPHHAAEVLKNGYGDCKDYVVLMQALLAARGIEAQMAAIDWGRSYIDLPIGSPYSSNHAILYLPQYDRYVNPTDRYAPFDALDRRLSGKTTILMTPEGGVGHTPAATPEANRYRYEATLTLTRGGTFDGTAQYTLSPNEESTVRNRLAESTTLEALARRVLMQTPEGGFGTFASTPPRDLLQPLKLSASWHSPMAVNPQGHDIYLQIPQGLDIEPPAAQREKLAPDGKRHTPILADVADRTWQTTIVLPPSMIAAHLPPAVDIETEAGHFTANYRAEPGRIIATRHLLLTKQVVPPDQYAALETLLYAPVVDARAVVVLTDVTD